MDTTNEDDWLTTTPIAERYGVEAATVRTWAKFKGFPDHARRNYSPGTPVAWHVPGIDAWLRSRVLPRKQRPARWWAVVDVESYSDRKTKAGAAR